MKTIKESLTFDDVLIVPNYSEILPSEVKLQTSFSRNININIPFVSAGMDTVTEEDMAIALAQEGGIGVIHRAMPFKQQLQMVKMVKKHESGIVTNPLTIAPDQTIENMLDLKKEHKVSTFPVVSNRELVGIVTSRDIRFKNDLSAKIATVMTPKDKLIVANSGTDRQTLLALFDTNKTEKILLVKDKKATTLQLAGLVTAKDLEKHKKYPNASKDSEQRLLVAACIGTKPEQFDNALALATAGVDAIVIDTAHAHSKNVIDLVKSLKDAHIKSDIVAGNIATAKAAEALLTAGADAIKVGIGPGSICTTRIVSGIGVPQITAIADVAAVLKGTGVPLIADGGIRYSGDVGKAIVAGADSVMLGSMFAGTDEAPGEIEMYQGLRYKAYRGMGSIAAMTKTNNSRDRYSLDDNLSKHKLVPEGVEGRKPYKGSLKLIVGQLTGGLSATLGYTGCKSIAELQHNGELIKISNSSLRESHVHNVSISKQPPNYPRSSD